MIEKICSIVEKIAMKVMTQFFLFFHRQMSEEIEDSILQFIRFGMVGVSNTIVSYAIYAISLGLMRWWNLLPAIDYLAAQIIMFILSVLWSFYWNNRMVFKKKKKKNMWIVLGKTYLTYAFTGLFLSEILLILWVQCVGVSEFIAPIFNLLITVPLNFVIHKFWVFQS